MFAFCHMQTSTVKIKSLLMWWHPKGFQCSLSMPLSHMLEKPLFHEMIFPSITSPPPSRITRLTQKQKTRQNASQDGWLPSRRSRVGGGGPGAARGRAASSGASIWKTFVTVICISLVSAAPGTVASWYQQHLHCQSSTCPVFEWHCLCLSLSWWTGTQGSERFLEPLCYL